MAVLTTIAGQFTVQIEVAGGRPFLEIHDENGLRYSKALDNIIKIAGRLLAEDAVPCPECDNTGIIDTGNNELPCRCKHADKVMFNVAGRGQVSGAQLKRER